MGQEETLRFARAVDRKSARVFRWWLGIRTPAIVFPSLGVCAPGGLRAFTLRRRIEKKAALFEAMKLGVALGARCQAFEAGERTTSAIWLQRARVTVPDHAGRVRAEMIVLARGTLRRLRSGRGFFSLSLSR